MRRVPEKQSLVRFLQEIGTLDSTLPPDPVLSFRIVEDVPTRTSFDRALQLIHYSGPCHRVGRCMRIAVWAGQTWIGGVVLGSTFPNIRVRDEVLGLRRHVNNWRKRGLISPWARENNSYWRALQGVVNHARTFILPPFQGRGLGVRVHGLLVSRGRELWETKYRDRLWAMDTLCTHPNSRLFAENGWQLVGRTSGYTSNPGTAFSRRAFREEWTAIVNNVALRRIRGARRWWVWVRKFDS